jgi:hypothetical protein
MRQSGMALYGVFTMSAARAFVKSMVATCAIVSLLSVFSAHAQEAPPTRLPTIADCPHGYILGVQDTDNPAPLARDNSAQANTNDITVDGQMAAFKARQQQDAAYASSQAQAPRAFVTGCVLPQQLQQR